MSEEKESEHVKIDQPGQKEEKISEKITEKTGYEPGELLKAPVEPPGKVKNPRPASNNQKTAIISGVILIIIGFILWGAISFWAFVVLAFCGVFLIAYGGMARI
ncbi:MAG: hypothetical protein ACREGF_04410 [Candidatus Saccharimonadales bacterium]